MGAGQAMTAVKFTLRWATRVLAALAATIVGWGIWVFFTDARRDND